MITTDDRVVAVGSAEYARVVDFFYREAYLLDDRHFAEWLELFTDDVEYHMPVRTTVRPSVGDGFSDAMEYFVENRSSLTTRVRRLETERAWAEQPASRTRHLVANVLVEYGETDGEFNVRSAFLVTRTHGDKTYDFFSGERRDTLRAADDGLRIARREVRLDTTVLHSYNLSIFF